MNYEKMCGLLEGIVESEFNNVQEFRETNFSDKNLEQIELNKVSSELLNKLNSSLSEEQKDLLDEFDVALVNEWVNLCRFYFKEGVAAGLTNLKFLNNINSIGSFFR